MAEKQKFDLYQMITDRILAAIEQDNLAPWHQPWAASGKFPRNGVTGKVYKGINVLLLGTMPYADPRWLTFNQAKKLGGKVKKGEKSVPVVFWKFFDNKKEDESQLEAPTRRIPMLRYYNVFNVEQIEELKIKPWEEPAPRNSGERITLAEATLAGAPHPPKVVHNCSVACYIPNMDMINMPNVEHFDTVEAYYATRFHEEIHATGHASRLNREGITNPTRFGTEKYSKEELIAEMGSAFLCAQVGIEPGLDQSAAYIKGWAQKFKEDKKILISAAGAAQKATEHILNREEVVEEEEETAELAAA